MHKNSHIVLLSSCVQYILAVFHLISYSVNRLGTVKGHQDPSLIQAEQFKVTQPLLMGGVVSAL